MTTSAVTRLSQLVSRLREQDLEMATLQVALNDQFTRIAYMQTELDGLSFVRGHRQTLLTLPKPPLHNRHPRSHH